MEAPARSSQLRRWSPLWTSLAAVGLLVAATVCISSIALNDQVFNFARYLIRGGTGAPAGGRRHLAVAAPEQPAGQGSPHRQLGRPGAARPGQRRRGHWHLGVELERLRAVRGDQPKPGPDHKLGRLGSALGELSLVVGVLLAIANVARGRGSSRR
jgi:hypothetical protein